MIDARDAAGRDTAGRDTAERDVTGRNGTGRNGAGRGLAERDRAAVAAQLGREPRGVRRVASRCPCGNPVVIETAPRLPDGTPFPTLFYLTCPKAASAIGTLEGGGAMREMQERLAADPELKAAYTAAHDDYLRRRGEAAREDGVEPLPPGTQSAGGMPERVKCLHALVAHELAVPGANPFGREALDALPDWWRSGPCVETDVEADAEADAEADQDREEEGER
ncbi:DUF501 domain-containing protein [Actinomadura syzygii]|uniref:DUF501 domain-containing protein n=1 Tax=Actinomadura syzygii TaxID=1427538 RepID=A0A5D0U5B5_9ACTN|nr:DUF501 domain-containing protein [Actinomadura syzygii]TYC13598.1 DUF501 domain-containing protein [Actinomadura syzygii]